MLEVPQCHVPRPVAVFRPRFGFQGLGFRFDRF
jgi:hypothetical protein